MSEQEYDEEIRVVRTPRGTKRTQSRSTPDFERDLLRDEDGNLRGPTESRALTDEDLESFQGRHDDDMAYQAPVDSAAVSTVTSPTDRYLQAFAAGAVEGMFNALIPHIERGVNKGAKKVKSEGKRLFSSLRKERKAKPNSIKGSHSTESNEQQETLTALIAMSPEEYGYHFALKTIAEQVSMQQEAFLARADISEEGRSHVEVEFSAFIKGNSLSIDERLLIQILEGSPQYWNVEVESRREDRNNSSE